MLIEYRGPHDPIDFGFFNHLTGGFDVDVISASATEIVFGNPATGAVTVLTGFGFPPDPEQSQTGTVTGFVTSDVDDNLITAFSGMSWPLADFVNALVALFDDSQNEAPLDALLNLQDITVDLADAVDRGIDLAYTFGGVFRNITIIGSDFGDTLEGGMGNDTIDPGSTFEDSGRDVIYSSPGNDVFDFQDVLPFLGNVELIYENRRAAITVNIDGAANTGSIVSSLGTTTLRDVANVLDWDTDGFGIWGSDLGDTFTVNGGPQSWIAIQGGDGADSYDLTLDGIVRLSFRWSWFSSATEGAQVNLQSGVIANDGFGNAETVTITPGAGRIELDGTVFADVFTGSAGDDRFILNDGNDTVDGGGGFDTLRYDRSGYSTGVTVDLATGIATGAWDGRAFTDRLSSIEAIRGTDFADSIAGGSAGEELSGYDGNDTLLGNGGNDTLYGGAGADFLAGGAGDDLIWGDAGTNTIYTGLGNDTVQGGVDGDVIFGGGTGSNQLFGNEGNDTIYAGAGGDFIGGGAGNDLIHGGPGANTIYGGLGRDTVQGGTGNEMIFGGGDSGNALFGNDGNDVITAGSGSDFLAGGAGNDRLFGGAGTNTIYLGLGDDFAGGGAGNDVIFGGAGTNTIYGGLGNDTVQGGSGDDAIHGGGNGANVLYGNGGNDVITAGSGNDFLAGGAGNDTIYGGAGNNTIYLGTGDDLVGGGQGNDLITAGAGNNRIYGGTGNDTIVAGTGRDITTAGPGADVFVFNSAAQAGIGAGRDVITDFEVGVDRIDLSALNLTFVGSAAFSGTAGELRYIPGYVVGDLDGDGVNDFAIELSGAPALSAGDFIL